MPLDRGQDLVNENVEDDAMPPLVDNPSPNYTFLSEMTTLSFTSTPAPSATQANSPQPTVSFPSSPALSPTTSEEPASMVVAPPRTHGKKRDASYIPRPPNAFILFRCAFIKEQNVPGKVEGNHSRLSKIIGLCWKQLPQEERDKWEAKAVEAQAEHRAQYPDWRFRPASNAMSKPKAKDAGEGTSRPRSVHGHGRARDQQPQELPMNSATTRPDAKGKGKERGSAKAKTTHPLSFEEVRCAKIAELVAEGLKGDDLEIAVREWEGKHRLTKAAGPKASKSKARSRETRSTSLTKLQSDVASTSRTSRRTSKRKPLEKATEGCLSTSSQSSPTPTQDSVPNAGSSEPSDPRPTPSTVVDPGGAPVLPDVPLTQMYRRSSSVPTSHNTLSRVSSSTVSSEDSSTDKISTTSAERSPTTWGSLKSAVPQDVEPTRTHNPSGLDTISFSIPAKTTTFDSSHHLTWQEAESRRRIEESQEPNSWWAQRSQATDSRFIYNQSSEQSSNVLQPLSASGFGVASGGSHSNNGYVAQYRSFESQEDGNQHFAWGSSADRSNHVIVIDDPYKDDCNVNDNTQDMVSPPPAFSQPMSSSYYHSRLEGPTPPVVPSSSFSSLTGWAGDYKDPSSDMRSWPPAGSSNPIASSSPSSSTWYSQDGSIWGANSSSNQPPPLQMTHSDWDRIEDRAANGLRLQVDPPRQLDFMTELRRMHNANSQS